MIRLTKGAKPAVLANNETTWTEEYIRYRTGATVPKAARTRYRHPEIKAAVKSETHNKCAYCESMVSHVAPGDVEHIVPKSLEPARVVDWQNLTHSCSECNRHKGDAYDPSMPLLHPYEDDPEQFLTFDGPWIGHGAGAKRGYLTRKQVALNRPDLILRRVEALEELQTLFDRYADETTPTVKEFLLNELISRASAKGEYSAMARAFLRVRNLMTDDEFTSAVAAAPAAARARPAGPTPR